MRAFISRVPPRVSQIQLGGVRRLNVHEYVGMDIMRKFDIPVPKGGMGTSVDEIKQVYKDLIGEGQGMCVPSLTFVDCMCARIYDNKRHIGLSEMDELSLYLALHFL